MSSIPKVAIACQGGGSHAAFAAGVLLRLLGPLRDRFELVALSGTSGGAMCASLAWAGLISSGHDDAVRRLTDFWRDLEVHDFADALTNFWSLFWANAPVAVEVSPYLYEPIAESRLRSLLRKHLALETIESHIENHAKPRLYIGATDVLSGERAVFDGQTLTYDDLIASAAVPPIFRPSQRMEGCTGMACSPLIRRYANSPTWRSARTKSGSCRSIRRLAKASREPCEIS